MKTLSVASGKGGAGKTSIAAALAFSLKPRSIFADCDVDAANGAIALRAESAPGEPYRAGPGYMINPAHCSSCGACRTACRFSAISGPPETDGFSIIPELCERCAACMDVCPSRAIETFVKTAGMLYVSSGGPGIPIVHAELVPGEDTSGKLVSLVRKRAQEIAANLTNAVSANATGEETIIVVDCPPGIGCPVIASTTGADLVLLVIEASASGNRDASRLVTLLKSMKRQMVAVINKTGLNETMDRRARGLAIDSGIVVAGEIPFDPALRSAEESGKTWVSAAGEAGSATRRALRNVEKMLESTITSQFHKE